MAEDLSDGSDITAAFIDEPDDKDKREEPVDVPADQHAFGRDMFEEEEWVSVRETTVMYKESQMFFTSCFYLF